MAKKQLSEEAQKFIELLFSTDPKDFKSERARLQYCKTEAGYGDNTTAYGLMKHYKDEILDYTKKYLAMHSPRAAAEFVKILENPVARGADRTLKAAAEVLDRAGIVKKDELEITGEVPSAVLVLGQKEATDLSQIKQIKHKEE